MVSIKFHGSALKSLGVLRRFLYEIDRYKIDHKNRSLDLIKIKYPPFPCSRGKKYIELYLTFDLRRGPGHTREGRSDPTNRGRPRRAGDRRYRLGGLPELPHLHRDAGGGHCSALRVPRRSLCARAPRPASLRHYAVHLEQPQGTLLLYTYCTHTHKNFHMYIEMLAAAIALRYAFPAAVMRTRTAARIAFPHRVS